MRPSARRCCAVGHAASRRHGRRAARSPIRREDRRDRRMERDIGLVDAVVDRLPLGIRLEPAIDRGHRRGSPTGDRRARRRRPRRRSPRPPAAVSRTRGTSTVNPVTSALIWFQASLRAGPPHARIALHLDPGGEHRLGDVPDRERGRLEDRPGQVRPAVPEREPGEGAAGASGPRAASARRRGTAGRRGPPRPARSPPPRRSGRRSTMEPPRTSLANQSSAAPVAAIAPPTEYRPGSGAGVVNPPATSIGRIGVDAESAGGAADVDRVARLEHPRAVEARERVDEAGDDRGAVAQPEVARGLGGEAAEGRAGARLRRDAIDVKAGRAPARRAARRRPPGTSVVAARPLSRSASASHELRYQRGSGGGLGLVCAPASAPRAARRAPSRAGRSPPRAPPARVAPGCRAR